jgi:hypothetical protein
MGKQIILNFNEEVLEQIKNKCLKEQRSLTGQLLYLITKADLSEAWLQSYYKLKKSLSDGSKSSTVAIKIDDTIYWKLTAKAAQAEMSLTTFCELILILWANDLKFPKYLFQAESACSGVNNEDGSIIIGKISADNGGEITNVRIACTYTDNVIAVEWELDRPIKGSLWVIFKRKNLILYEFKLSDGFINSIEGCKMAGSNSFIIQETSTGLTMDQTISFEIIEKEDL